MQKTTKVVMSSAYNTREVTLTPWSHKSQPSRDVCPHPTKNTHTKTKTKKQKKKEKEKKRRAQKDCYTHHFATPPQTGTEIMSHIPDCFNAILVHPNAIQNTT